MTRDPQRAEYPFTDPLGAASEDAPRLGPKAMSARAGVFGYLAGAITLLTVLLLPDGDTSDHVGLVVISGLMLAFAVLLLVWRDLPDVVVLASPTVGTILISALVAVTRPLALTPIFYVWPLVLAAYFLQRRDVAIVYGCALVGFGVALVGWAVPESRGVMWASVAILGGVLTVLVLALKERLTGVVADLRALATRDPLTGVLNRRAFSAALDAAVARAARGGDRCAVALLDVDHFKRINDAWGHAEGDRALQDVTRTIVGRTRAADVVGRLGGEEFAVLLHAADADGAARYAEDLRAAIAGAAREARPALTVSIGVAALADGDDAERVLAAADEAMYAAKHAGRDRVVVAGS